MNLFNVVLATDPRGGKGGVATVVPMYLDALGIFGQAKFISTHNSNAVFGKFLPWIVSFFACFVCVLRNRKSSLIFHLHPGSGFCIVRMLILSIFLRWMLRRHVLIYLHTPYLESYLNSKFWNTIIRLIIKTASRTVVLTDYALQLLGRHGIKKWIRVVPNPYRSKNTSKKIFKRSSDDVLVLTMGRLVDGKGIVETVRSLAFLPENYKLAIAGEGELESLIIREIEDLRISHRVALKGWVDDAKRSKLMEDASVFCLPSRVDSFGMSFVEAQCFDLPIVAFAHPPVVEVISSCRAVFVQETTPKVLAEAIEQAHELGKSIEHGSGRSWIDASFGISKVSNLLENLCVEVCQGD
ncbi:glycosyltransferase [Paraburkholderia sp. Ac-20347]|uniref:glycosyltransferase family 4 protein n=1 Tax=Paraburkholderia sp. Ac-20347 TaxID=2703892 RepID=UPI0019808DC1|nr:glycosyltransferase [Paraburkholderia sp. Ac-20347]MBN3810609.1 glycosyltransferase [Paraburkholderia sp. Ac-20347]